MSKQPNPPPHGDKPIGTAPPPPPRGQLWLWPIALGVTLVLYIFLPGINISTPVSLSYSQFIADASIHKIKTVDGPSPRSSWCTVRGPMPLAGMVSSRG